MKYPTMIVEVEDVKELLSTLKEYKIIPKKIQIIYELGGRE